MSDTPDAKEAEIADLQRTLDARKARPKPAHPQVAARWKREDEELEKRIGELKKGKAK